MMYLDENGNERITPADAGKTICRKCTRAYLWDHPRGCGENIDPLNDNVRYLGSPPRMRGKPVVTPYDAGAGRITPADAGKTRSRQGRRAYCQDHPRGCGENIYPPCRYTRLTGSPPRMRGKLKRAGICPVYPGITPADAGKTEFVNVRNNV